MRIKKLFLRQWIPTVVVLIFGLSLALPVAAYERQMNRENMVSVDVVPIVLVLGKPVKFEVRMNTHSVSLDQNIVDISILTDDLGQEYLPVNWNGSPAGGHHRSEVLEFPLLKGNPSSVALVIQDIANVPERIFKWKIAP
jgi:hypothetical protein